VLWRPDCKQGRYTRDAACIALADDRPPFSRIDRHICRVGRDADAFVLFHEQGADVDAFGAAGCGGRDGDDERVCGSDAVVYWNHQVE